MVKYEDKDLDKNHAKITNSIIVFDMLSKYWLLFNCLIQPISNLIVLSLWQIKEYLISTTIISFKAKQEPNVSNDLFRNLLFYIIIGQMCFFSQGNSNSLNTIQISSGLVGINEMNMLVVGILMFSATYAANIFWYFVMIKNILCNKLLESKTRYIFLKIRIKLKINLYNLNSFKK